MRNARLIAAVLLVVGLLLGCGDGLTNDESTEPTDPTAPATEPSVTPVPNAPCTTAAVEAVVRAELDPGGTIPGSVEIVECQNEYARVFYRPDSPGYETEQIFLRDDGGQWVILTYGTGIDCADDVDLDPPELEDACRALSLRG